ncbi:MAG TPA: UDP-N-acetylmuramoyl-L-alanine--D-glutamate ligase [Acidimicrobiales bacterium]|nr:UDP-N-acetylmuramoyl-L-alanine--D-glutamate ligase [Acidimicrobiales bacterium]
MTSAGRALVVGLGQAGEAAARQLARRGWDVVVAEDRPGPASRDRAGGLAASGVDVVEAPDDGALDALVDGADLVVPSPGVPRRHRATARALARGTTVWTEFELAARWSSVPLVAVTGTNGKTTVTTLVAEMLEAGGRRTVLAGNNDLPLVDAIDLEGLDVVVVEASSFRLEFTETFAPRVGTWLNLAPDHLDWHGDMASYAAAKARLWANAGSHDVAVANAEDPVVLGAARASRARVVTFGLAGGDWHVAGEELVGPDGPVLAVGELARDLPHDRANALAAAATADAAGAAPDAVAAVLRSFRGLPHRITPVGEHGGVRWLDDSKATDPHAAVTAVRGFDSVVLVAGGRNKGLDLSVLAGEAGRLRAVVAIGEAAPEVAAAFAGSAVPVSVATSMDDAVARARAAARPGDVVLLSPGCASYDWYGGYGERGDDFARAVAEELART